MKIALMLYGQQREMFKTLVSWNKFMAYHTPDIFWHTWGSPPEYNIFSLKLKAGLVEYQREFDTHGVTEYSSSAKNVLSQMYSIMKVNSLVATEENLGFHKYDWIVRSRFDLGLHNSQSIDFDSLDPTKYYVCSNHWGGAHGMFDDNIMITSSVNSDMLHSTLFQYANYFINTHKVIPSGEQLIFDYFNTADIMKHLVKINSLDFTLARNL